MMPFAIPRTIQYCIKKTSHELNNLKVFVAQYQFLSVWSEHISTNFSALAFGSVEARVTCVVTSERDVRPDQGRGLGLGLIHILGEYAEQKLFGDFSISNIQTQLKSAFNIYA